MQDGAITVSAALGSEDAGLHEGMSKCLRLWILNLFFNVEI